MINVNVAKNVPVLTHKEVNNWNVNTYWNGYSSSSFCVIV